MKKKEKRFCILNKFFSITDITDKICDLYEGNDYLYYYVSDDKIIRRRFLEERVYTFYLYGNDGYIEDKRDVCYVFCDIVFEKEVLVSCFMKSKVIFKNCTFGCGIKLFDVDNVLFYNNKYNYYHGIKNFLCGYGKRLEFYFDNVLNNDNGYYFNMFDINVKFDDVYINNSNIIIDDVMYRGKLKRYNDEVVVNNEFMVRCDRLFINNSFIDVPSFYIDCNNVFIDSDSVIFGKKGLMIDCLNVDDIIDKNIISSCFVCNGVYLDDYVCYKFVNVISNILKKRCGVVDNLNIGSKDVDLGNGEFKKILKK